MVRPKVPVLVLVVAIGSALALPLNKNDEVPKIEDSAGTGILSENKETEFSSISGSDNAVDTGPTDVVVKNTRNVPPSCSR